jgi:hypothetical protein
MVQGWWSFEYYQDEIFNAINSQTIIDQIPLRRDFLLDNFKHAESFTGIFTNSTAG